MYTVYCINLYILYTTCIINIYIHIYICMYNIDVCIWMDVYMYIFFYKALAKIDRRAAYLRRLRFFLAACTQLL